MKTITLKKSKAIKNNMVERETYTVTAQIGNNAPTTVKGVFVEYKRGEDFTKQGIILEDSRGNRIVAPINDSTVVTWEYKELGFDDLTNDPLRCGDLARQYIKYGLTEDKDPHKVARAIQTGWRPW